MRPLAADAALTVASHAVAAAVALALQVLLARSLTAQVFGAFVLVQAAVVVVESIFVARAGEVALYWLGRTWAQNPALARGYARFLRRRELTWNAGIYLALLAAAWPLALALDLDARLLALLALGIPLQSGYGVAKSVFIAAGRIRAQANFEIAYNVATLVAAVALTLAFGLLGFIAAVLLTTTIKSIAGHHITEHFWPAAVRGAAPLAPPASALSAHALLRQFCNSVAAQGDVLILGAAASKETVALYRVAKTVAGVPARIAAPMWSVLRPGLLRALGDAPATRRLILGPALAFAALGILFVPLAWLGGDLLAALFGETYRVAAAPFLVLLAGFWWYGGVTGWLGFVATISAAKSHTSTLYVLLLALTLGGALLAGGSALHMAIAVALAMALVGVIAWTLLLRGKLVC
jgi:O-antigen/teichoic acid export membrane protein